MNSILGLLFILIFIGCATRPPQPETSIPPVETASEITTFKTAIVEAPQEKGIILDHKYFIVSYNKDHRLANYVEYTLTKKNVQDTKFKRTDKFFADPQLLRLGIEPVVKKDYLRSGYDKGHLAPAEDFSWSRDSIDETFVMTNMTPQKGSLNQRAWKYLEARVRKWACGEEKIVVSTGPILENGLKKLKKTISIPNRFFKAVLDETPPKKAVCFIYNQTDSMDVYKDRAMSLKDCEKEIGFKLFSEMSSRERASLEKDYNLVKWKEAVCK